MTFGLAYCDHVVLYRFTPRGLHLTDCEITWLVNENAVEGRDYDLANLIWLWDVTTIADKAIIERNQAGVDSRYYVPGPLSPSMEPFTQQFLNWYVAAMRRSRAADCRVAGLSLLSGRLRRDGHDRPESWRRPRWNAGALGGNLGRPVGRLGSRCRPGAAT